MRGHLRLRHRKACPLSTSGADSWNARACRCSPTVEARFGDDSARIGYLERGWRKSDLGPFERRLGDLRAQRERGTPVRSVTLGQWADEWFDDLYEAALAGLISKDTYNAYEQRWRLHLEAELAHVPIVAVTGKLLRKIVRKKAAEGELAPRTINELLTPVSAMLTDAVDAGLVAANAARQPRRGRHGAGRRNALYLEIKDDGRKHLEIDEARALLTAARESEVEDLYDMVLTGLTTGGRRSEILGWRFEDLLWGLSLARIDGQLRRGQYVRAKAGSEGAVVLYSRLADSLARRRRAEGFIFVDADGRPWRTQEIDGHLRDAYKAAGVWEPGRLWHALRHTFASVLSAGGIRREVIEQLLRHRRHRPETTDIYIHMLRDAYEGVEEVLDAAFNPDRWQPASVSTSARPSDVREVHGNGGSQRDMASNVKAPRRRF